MRPTPLQLNRAHGHLRHLQSRHREFRVPASDARACRLGPTPKTWIGPGEPVALDASANADSWSAQCTRAASWVRIRRWETVRGPEVGRVRLRDMWVTARTCGALAACLLLGACESTDAGVAVGGGGDCTSRYEPVARGETYGALREAMIANTDWGRVASLRTQARGDEVKDGPGAADVVRVMDLLNRNGRRLVQVDVWRTDEGWRAGVWLQCID